MASSGRYAGGILALAYVLVAAPVAAQDDGDAPRLSLSGFVSATMFAQDQSFGFGNGQSAVWAMPDRVDEDSWFTGGDVRNTRLRVTLEQMVAEGAEVRAIVEADFFGTFNGTGPFSDEQPQPRLRLAHVDLHLGRTSLRFGQMFTPLMGTTPVSLTHIAFPLGLASAGVIGWRHPGVALEHRVVDQGPTRVALQVGAFRGSWSGPGNNLDQQSAGEAASVPQLEARVDVRHDAPRGPSWSAYVVGHYDRKDLDGIGVPADADPDPELEGLGLAAGGTAAWGPASLRGNGYIGRALGQQFGQLGQFGDISGWGAWVQPGLRLHEHWDAFLFVGRDDPSDHDLVATVAGLRRTENHSAAAMLRYSLGPYALSLEGLHVRTDWCEDAMAGPATHWSTTARQLSVSMLYRF